MLSPISWAADSLLLFNAMAFDTLSPDVISDMELSIVVSLSEGRRDGSSIITKLYIGK